MQWIKNKLLPNSVRDPLRRVTNRAVGIMPEGLRELVPEAVRVHNTKRSEREFWRMLNRLATKIKTTNDYTVTVPHRSYGGEEREMGLFDVVKEITFRKEAAGDERQVGPYTIEKIREAGVTNEYYKENIDPRNLQIHMFPTADIIVYRVAHIVSTMMYGLLGFAPEVREGIQSLDEIRANPVYKQVYETRCVEGISAPEEREFMYVNGEIGGELRVYYQNYFYPTHYRLTPEEQEDRFAIQRDIADAEFENNNGNNEGEPNFVNMAALMSDSVGTITTELVEGLPIRGTISIVNPGDDIMGDSYETGDIVIVIKKKQGNQIVNIPEGEIKPIHMAKVETIVALLQYQQTADQELGRPFSKKFKHPYDQGRYVKDMNELVKYRLDIPRAATLQAKKEEENAARRSADVIRRQGRAGSVVKGGKRKMRKTRKHKTRGRK